MRSTAGTIAAFLVLSGCHETTSSSDGLPSAASSAATAVTPSTTTTTTPSATTTTATTASPANHDPVVSLSGPGECHPKVGTPCELVITASASDEDGDPLAYTWSGCATGDAPEATCRIGSPGTFTARVAVDDGRGGRAEAETTVLGINNPPVIPAMGCGYYPPCLAPDPPAPSQCPAPVPTDANGYCGYSFFDGNDPDGDRVQCGPRVSVDGPCSAGNFFECGGVEDSASFDFHALSTPGECVFTVVFTDEWGAQTAKKIHVAVRAR